ncbi:hypothetical protein HK107_03215 [Parvularcula sp. ZS-1/3]|uniref:Uncharacterized protein n=1 Tax=Parvularcula mediterranea TaxID=2732508 RepID=A0A7Y3W422_9PROT|nr:hypothetical protein [Parvularcula mediterranea]NNU15335.1 hypothetical protein [Parvularcula mediterranea]
MADRGSNPIRFAFRLLFTLVIAALAAPLPLLVVFVLQPSLGLIFYVMGFIASGLLLLLTAVPIGIALFAVGKPRWWMAAVPGGIIALTASFYLKDYLAADTVWYHVLSVLTGVTGAVTALAIWQNTGRAADQEQSHD